jgi:hypothetical protein
MLTGPGPGPPGRPPGLFAAEATGTSAASRPLLGPAFTVETGCCTVVPTGMAKVPERRLLVLVIGADPAAGRRSTPTAPRPAHGTSGAAAR